MVHKAAKVELASEDRVYADWDGFITTAAPTGIASTDVSRVLCFQEPGAQPSTSKSEERHEGTTGDVAHINKLTAQVEQEAKVDEDAEVIVKPVLAHCVSGVVSLRTLKMARTLTTMIVAAGLGTKCPACVPRVQHWERERRPR